MARIDELATFSEEADCLTRRFLTEELVAANTRTAEWMVAAGMRTRVDAVGNLFGRYESDPPGGRALLLGSHLDTVRNAGRFDGPLGVLAAISVVERLHEASRRFPFAVEIVAFADEEGVRFGSTALGSRAVAGLANETDLARKDETGLTVAAAMRGLGLDPHGFAGAALTDNPPLAYLELHIEQGPTLEEANRPLGCVSAITGSDRLLVTLTGEAGHAGTVPMDLRRDALAAFAECALALERRCRNAAIVGTVGYVANSPNAGNVIPGSVDFSLDIRSADDAARAELIAALFEEMTAIARRRGVTLAKSNVGGSKVTPCAPWLQDQIRTAVRAVTGDCPTLASGAGHDGIAMSAICDIGMMFIRCEKGISHNPAEAVALSDMAAALAALDRCVEMFRSPATSALG